VRKGEVGEPKGLEHGAGSREGMMGEKIFRFQELEICRNAG